jgi:uncharacterized membrane protein
MQNNKLNYTLIISLVIVVIGSLLSLTSHVFGIVKENNIKKEQAAELQYCTALSKFGKSFSIKYSESKTDDDIYDLVVTKLNEQPELAPLKVFVYTSMNNGSNPDSVKYFIEIECLHHGKEKYLSFLKERLIKESEKEMTKEISQ